MKMNPIKFAELIGYISYKIGNSLVATQVQAISNIIDEGIEPQALPTNVSKSEITVALMNVQDHMLTNNKIEAVKCLRKVTDMGFKEAKDWVERWPVYSPNNPG